jgi:hypothetical protein
MLPINFEKAPYDSLYFQYQYFCNKAAKGDYDLKERFYNKMEFVEMYQQYLLNSAGSY